jgi:hypothetical protein
MSTLLNTIETNQKIISLWDKYWASTFCNETIPEIAEILSRKPLLYPYLKKSELLFIGCNPSFGKSSIATYMKNESIPYSLDQFYHYKSLSNNEKLNLHIELGAKRKIFFENGGVQYSKELKGIAEYLNLSWEHIDMFLISETNQKNVKNILEKYEDFKNDQIDIACEIIELIEPKIIIVNNAYVAHLFRDGLMNCKRKESIKSYSCIIGNIEVPVFLIGMLSGGNTDKESKERLKWHIKMYLQQRELFETISLSIE